MTKTKKLLINTMIFGIGNIGSKLILFILIPIYTFYLSTEQYGYVDLITTIITLAIPTVSFCISEAALRFVLDNKNNHIVIFNTGFVTIVVSSVILLLIGVIIGNIIHVEYLFLIMFVLIFQMINIFLSQYIKGLQKNIIYSLNSIILSFLMLSFTLVLFNMNLNVLYAYFLAQLLAYMFSVMFIMIFAGVLKTINLTKFNINILKSMMIYSFPLIPNQIMWWVMNLSDRFFISYFIGLSGNGIYAVASKIPSILNIVSAVFIQAWQISAIEEKDSREKNIFYSNVFNSLSSFLLIIISMILCVLKIIIDYFLAESYGSVWRYVPFLLLSLLFSNFSMFIGMNYLANMKTSGIFKTSIYGAIINIVLNFLLIPQYGINGASISTMLSFLVVWIIRMKETRHFVQIKVDWMTMISSITFILLQIVCLYFSLEVLNYILFGLILLLNIKYIKRWLKLLINRD
jgi:O-antigen/teichoic acid export membrane protein